MTILTTACGTGIPGNVITSESQTSILDGLIDRAGSDPKQYNVNCEYYL